MSFLSGATALLCIILLVAGWHLFERWWDGKLFSSGSGSVCRNGSARAAREFLALHEDTQILDVRSAAEFRGGALPNARHISLGDADFVSQLQSLEKFRPILVYCAGGYRSRKAVKILKQQGFQHIQHLHRGFYSWKMAGFPTDKTLAPQDRTTNIL